MSGDIEELGDLIDALKNCNENMGNHSSDFNETMAMPVFVHIENRMNAKIKAIDATKATLSSPQVDQFEDFRKTGEELLESTKKGWSKAYLEAYQTCATPVHDNSHDKAYNVKELTAGVDQLKKLAMMLSKDMRGDKHGGLSAGPGGKRLSEIDREQVKCGEKDIQFEKKSDDRCCLLL